MAKTTASKLKEGAVVTVMGVDYRVDAVEKDDADIDLFLEPVDETNPAFLTINAHPNTIVHYK